MAAFNSSLTTALASPRGRGRGEVEEDMGGTYIEPKEEKMPTDNWMEGEQKERGRDRRKACSQTLTLTTSPGSKRHNFRLKSEQIGFSWGRKAALAVGDNNFSAKQQETFLKNSKNVMNFIFP